MAVEDDKEHEVDISGRYQNLSIDEVSKFWLRNNKIFQIKLFSGLFLFCLPFIIITSWVFTNTDTLTEKLCLLLILTMTFAPYVFLVVIGLMGLIFIFSYFTYREELKEIKQVKEANPELWQQAMYSPVVSRRIKRQKRGANRFKKSHKILLILMLVVTVFISIYFVIGTLKTSNVSLQQMEKVGQTLKEKYGENFKVISGTYNSQSKSYSYTVIPESMPDERMMVITDLAGKGSFISNYLLVRTSLEVAKMLKPYFKPISDNFATRTLATSIYDQDLAINERYLPKEAEYVFRSKALHLKEWIKEYHKVLELTFTAMIEIPKKPQNLLTVMNQVYKLNNYLRSLKLFSFNMEIRLVNIPGESPLKKQKMDTSFFVRQKGYEMNKYTWAVLHISDCPINGVKKYCYNKPNIPQNADMAKNIHSPLDVANYIKLIPRHTVKADIFGDIKDSWAISRRYNSTEAQFLINSPLYLQIIKLQTKEKNYE